MRRWAMAEPMRPVPQTPMSMSTSSSGCGSSAVFADERLISLAGSADVGKLRIGGREICRPGRRNASALLPPRDRLGGAVEIDALDHIADFASIQDVGDVGQPDDVELSLIAPERVLDPGAHLGKRPRIVGVGAGGIAHGDTDLADALEAAHDQGAVAVMERLVTADE